MKYFHMTNLKHLVNDFHKLYEFIIYRLAKDQSFYYVLSLTLLKFKKKINKKC